MKTMTCDEISPLFDTLNENLWKWSRKKDKVSGIDQSLFIWKYTVYQFYTVPHKQN